MPSALSYLRQFLPASMQTHTPDEAQIQTLNPYSKQRALVYTLPKSAYEGSFTGGARGVSLPEGMKAGDAMRAAFSPVGRQALYDVMRGRDPAFVPQGESQEVTQHEMLHQTMGGNPFRLPPEVVKSLIPEAGWRNLVSQTGTQAPLAAQGQPGPYNYSEHDALGEVPVRLVTEPESLGMSKADGLRAANRYVKLLRKQDPAAADQLEKQIADIVKSQRQQASKK